MSACLMLCLLILQFMPYWHYGDPQTDVSIQGYVWFPTNHSALDKEIKLKTDNPDFQVTDIIAMPIIELLVCAFGIVLCTWKSKVKYMAVFPLSAGIVGIIGYLQPAFRLGSLWQLHVALCVMLAVVGVIQLLIEARKE